VPIHHQVLKHYLKGLGWTQEDLVGYLDLYEIRITDFEDMEDLQEILGEPLTEEHLHKLPEKYGWTLEEAVEVLMENWKKEKAFLGFIRSMMTLYPEQPQQGESNWRTV